MGICQDTAARTGQHMLFCGIETVSWSLAQFEQAAQFARSHHIDSLIIKVADGANRWYGSFNGFLNIRKAILAQGTGCIPYTFMYGDSFGALGTELEYLKEYISASAGGIVCADMERQWNNRADWAETVCAVMRPVPGILLVTTWADPNEQGWKPVLQALNPCVNAYIPQQYDDYLASTWGEFAADGAQCLFPAVDLSNEFGPNHPATIAANAYKERHAALVVWYYGFAVSNPALLDLVLAQFPEGIRPVTTPTQSLYDTNANIKKSLDDYWNSSASLLGGKPAPMNTGIHSAWVIAALGGHFMGAPLSLEYHSSDWNGAAITCQNFPGGRCEWKNGTASWYGTNGPMNI